VSLLSWIVFNLHIIVNYNIIFVNFNRTQNIFTYMLIKYFMILIQISRKLYNILIYIDKFLCKHSSWYCYYLVVPLEKFAMIDKIELVKRQRIMSMIEYISTKVQFYFLKSLSLAFIYGHFKSWYYRTLSLLR